MIFFLFVFIRWAPNLCMMLLNTFQNFTFHIITNHQSTNPACKVRSGRQQCWFSNLFCHLATYWVQLVQHHLSPSYISRSVKLGDVIFYDKFNFHRKGFNISEIWNWVCWYLHLLLLYRTQSIEESNWTILVGEKIYSPQYWKWKMKACTSGKSKQYTSRWEICTTRANCSRKVREIESGSWQMQLGWRDWQMIICKRPAPQVDHLQEAGHSEWSFARDWPLWMIIC